MKAYLMTTGTLFGAVAVVHIVLTVGEWQRLTTDPGFVVEGPVLGAVAAALCVWAWRLVRMPARPMQR